MADTQTLGNWVVPNNYIYISHLVGEKYLDGTEIEDPYFLIPTDPDTISDFLGSSWQETTALSRTAPIMTYSNSGPRKVQFSFKLHRDMMDDLNVKLSNFKLGEDGRSEDYVDALIRILQSIALPKMNLSNKLIEPPMVAVKIGSQIFIKGVVNGGVTVSYEKPMLYPDGKYAVATVSFEVTEIDPYNSTGIYTNGSFRGLTSTMKEKMTTLYSNISK